MAHFIIIFFKSWALFRDGEVEKAIISHKEEIRIQQDYNLTRDGEFVTHFSKYLGADVSLLKNKRWRAQQLEVLIQYQLSSFSN